MDGAIRNLLLELARNGGSVSAGFNVDVDYPDAVVERAVRGGYVSVYRSSWATGDHYDLTRKGWSATGLQSPPHWRDEPTPRQKLAFVAVICAVCGTIALIDYIF